MKSAAGVLCVLALCGCVTAKDAVGGGDARLDETQQGEALKREARAETCGPDGQDSVVVLDAATGAVLPCLAVTVTNEPVPCGDGCTPETLFKGATNRKGQLEAKLSGIGKLTLLAEGYAPTSRPVGSIAQGKLLELELAPMDNFWLKVLDAEGNYLPNLKVSFKLGDEVFAQPTSNVLANLVFSEKQPFAGQTVIAQAEGFQPVTIASAEDLGDDGHTLVLKK